MGGGTQLVGRGQWSAGKDSREGFARMMIRISVPSSFKLGIGSDAAFRRDVCRVNCRQLLIR